VGHFVETVEFLILVSKTHVISGNKTGAANLGGILMPRTDYGLASSKA